VFSAVVDFSLGLSAAVLMRRLDDEHGLLERPAPPSILVGRHPDGVAAHFADAEIEPAFHA
jgi:hypothetical protein